VAFVREHFDRARLARRYIDVLEDAIAAGRCVSSVSREKTRAS
jgi:hypothetical protein